jgi:hypothetical protein
VIGRPYSLWRTATRMSAMRGCRQRSLRSNWIPQSFTLLVLKGKENEELNCIHDRIRFGVLFD